MKIIDAILWGWYQILDKTIYLNSQDKDDFGPKEHGFFIAFLLHGLNIYTLLSYVFIEFWKSNVETYISITTALIVFLIGYLIYFKRKRMQKVVAYDISNAKGILYIVLTILYSIASVYLMWIMGEHVREVLVG